MPATALPGPEAGSALPPLLGADSTPVLAQKEGWPLVPLGTYQKLQGPDAELRWGVGARHMGGSAGIRPRPGPIMGDFLQGGC